MSGVDNVIECAIEYAENRHHEYVTVEHLMLCLLETPEISEIVDAITDDRETAINDLKNYLDDKEFNGLVQEVNDRNRIKVNVNIFGRPTPIELSMNQILSES